MTLLNVIRVDPGGLEKRIELHQGDLTELVADEAIDILVLSAFGGDYLPTPRSLMGALYEKGISVYDLAQDKAVDLREAFSCWLSHPVNKTHSGIQFERILCFEPLIRGSAPDVVGDVFRAIAPFLGGDPRISTAAMPILATGDQGYKVEIMLPKLIEAAIKWMQIGMPLMTLKIYAYKDAAAAEAGKLFAKQKAQLATPDDITSDYQHDVFISYCRQNGDAARNVRSELLQAGLETFMDIQNLNHGSVWQQEIFCALDSCRRMVAIYTPDYVSSKMCQEEFNIAWARGRQLGLNLIYPVYWETTNLPTYMQMLNYVDCREGDHAKLVDACHSLIAELVA